MPLRAILFDKDGTLIDFQKTWSRAVYETLRGLADGDEGKFAELIAIAEYDVPGRRILPTSPVIASSSADYGRDWARIVGAEPNQAFFTRMDKMLIPVSLEDIFPIGELEPLIGGFRDAGLVVGICTNDSEYGARAQCERLGITELFDGIIGYDSGHGRKPAAGQIHAFARAHGLRTDEIALVGDSLHDLHAARAAGSVGIAVLTGPATRDVLEPDADHVIDSIMDLPPLVERLRA